MEPYKSYSYTQYSETAKLSTSFAGIELQAEYGRSPVPSKSIRMADRHFTAPVEEIDGTVASVSPGGITLKEFPGRKFQFSSVGLSAADMSAKILGEHNNLIRSEVANEVDRRRSAMRDYLAETLAGENVRLVIPKGADQVPPS